MTTPNLDDLLAIAAIRQLKARYCRFVDTKQWTRLKTVFSPGATVEGFGSVPDGSDADAFVKGIANRLGTAITVHHIHEPEIELDAGAKRARGSWPMMDYVEFSSEGGHAGPPPDRGWVGWGYYEDDYVCHDGTWLIAHMRLTRQRMDTLSAVHPRPAPGRIKPDPDWL